MAKILRSSVAMRAAAYTPAYSASATTKEQTTGMRVEWQEMGYGVVNPVIVVGEPEIAQATGDAACVRVGEEGAV